MNPTPEYVTTEAVGQALGEVLIAFTTVINTLRRQPGFDDALFTGELQEIMRNPELTTLQSHTFSLLLKHTPEAPDEPAGPMHN